jgi:sugar lactone lactonase YvrE
MVFRVTPPPAPKGKGNQLPKGEAKVEVLVDASKLKGLHTPNGLAMDGAAFLILADVGAGTLHRVKVADGSSEPIADGIDGADGLTWDYHGRLFVSSWKTARCSSSRGPGRSRCSRPRDSSRPPTPVSTPPGRTSSCPT